MTKAQLTERLKSLLREHQSLRQRFNAITPETVVYTLDTDMKAGMSIMVRVPRLFWPDVGATAHCPHCGQEIISDAYIRKFVGDTYGSEKPAR